MNFKNKSESTDVNVNPAMTMVALFVLYTVSGSWIGWATILTPITGGHFVLAQPATVGTCSYHWLHVFFVQASLLVTGGHGL